MRHLVIGTAGHIDHGKSTLVRALTGIDPDRLKEEKARGITIDLGFAHCLLGDTRIAFVDVPGHERFVRNMLAGATGIDAVLLVIAADESVMPQTREHFAICRLLDVRAGLIALTKCDAADADTIAIARADATELVAGSFLDGAPIIELSAKTAHGLDALREALVRVAATAPLRESAGPMRLPIDRAFSMKGFGAVVTGTLVSGSLRIDDDVDLLAAPRGATGLAARVRVRVRGLQVHGERVREAASGQRVAANLDGIDTAAIARGDLLATPDVFMETRTCDVALDLLPDAKPLTHGTRVRVHHGTREALARAGIVETTIAPGGRAHARLRLEAPMVMTRGDRFVLRAYSPVVTIGGGLVLDPHPPRGALRTPAARARFASLDPGADGDPFDPASTDRAAMLMLEERGRDGLPIAAFAGRLGLRGGAIDGAVGRLVQTSLAETALAPTDLGARSGAPPAHAGAGIAHTALAPTDHGERSGVPLAHAGAGAAHAGAAARAVRIGDLLFSRTVLDRLATALIEQVARHHAAQPASEGLPREEARDRLGIAPRVFEFVLQELATAEKVSGRDRLALPTHRVTVPDADTVALARVEAAVRASGLKPPEVSELALALRLPAATVERLVNLLLRQKRLIKVSTLVVHPDALARLKEETRALKAAAPAGRAVVNVASFKTRYDVSRKYAIPLLEYLDRERVTRRIGDERVVL
jgi:selenocysteine-specific elongation factor